mmetsp:Transcript_13654/g.43641  ORF Transcript_13654/g.43641 Transcript_13654/m.43641 type:complete len:827 (-) Transcript_13654:150-2630(-)
MAVALGEDEARQLPPQACAVRLAAARASCAVVLDAARRVKGIVTEQDLVRRALTACDNVGPETASVFDVMTPDPTCLAVEEERGSYLELALQTMARRSFRHVPVVRKADGGLIEVVDIVSAIAGAGNVEHLAHTLSYPAGKLMRMHAALAGNRGANSLRLGASTFREAANLMARGRRSSLVVLDGDGQLCGIVTESDLVRKVLAAGRSLDGLVDDIMTPKPFTVPIDINPFDGLHEMLGRSFRHLPVQDEEGCFVTVLDMLTLAKVSYRAGQQHGSPSGKAWKKLSEASHATPTKRVKGVPSENHLTDPKTIAADLDEQPKQSRRRRTRRRNPRGGRRRGQTQQSSQGPGEKDDTGRMATGSRRRTKHDNGRSHQPSANVKGVANGAAAPASSEQQQVLRRKQRTDQSTSGQRKPSQLKQGRHVKKTDDGAAEQVPSPTQLKAKRQQRTPHVAAQHQGQRQEDQQHSPLDGGPGKEDGVEQRVGSEEALQSSHVQSVAEHEALAGHSAPTKPAPKTLSGPEQEAILAIMDNRFERAVALLTTALEAEERAEARIRILGRRGNVLSCMGELARAMEDLEQACAIGSELRVELCPDGHVPADGVPFALEEARGGVCEILVETGRYEEAVARIQTTPSKHDDIMQQLQNETAKFKDLGRELFIAKDHTGAVAAYTSAIRAHKAACALDSHDEPEDESQQLGAILLSNRAACYQVIGDKRYALADAEAAVALDRTYTKAWVRVCTLLLELEKAQQCIARVEEALEVVQGPSHAPDPLVRRLGELKSQAEQVLLKQRANKLAAIQSLGKQLASSLGTASRAEEAETKSTLA